MVRSGRNPVVQVYSIMCKAKNLCEKKEKISSISKRATNNSYVLDEFRCCEVTDRTNEKDAKGKVIYFCSF